MKKKMGGNKRVTITSELEKMKKKMGGNKRVTITSEFRLRHQRTKVRVSMSLTNGGGSLPNSITGV